MKFSRRVWYLSTSSENALSSPPRKAVTTAESSIARSRSLTVIPWCGISCLRAILAITYPRIDETLTTEEPVSTSWVKVLAAVYDAGGMPTPGQWSKTLNHNDLALLRRPTCPAHCALVSSIQDNSGRIPYTLGLPYTLVGVPSAFEGLLWPVARLR